MDDNTCASSALARIVAAINNIAETIMDISEQIAELFQDIFNPIFSDTEVVFKAQKKYKLCLCVLLPPPSYKSIKLWRKNKAIFRR